MLHTYPPADFYGLKDKPVLGIAALSFWELNGQPIIWIQQIQQSKSNIIQGFKPRLHKRHHGWRSYLLKYIGENAKKAGIKTIIISTPKIVEEGIGHRIPAPALEENYGKKTMNGCGFTESETPLVIRHLVQRNFTITNYFYVKEL